MDVLKAILVPFFLFFFCNPMLSQKGKYNNFSIEMRYGLNIPYTPKDDISSSNYILPNHIDLGIRYMLDDYFGVKIHYAHDRFRDKNSDIVGNKFHRIGFEGIYNIGNNFYLFGNDFGMFFRAGIGVTYAYPESVRRFLNGGAFTFGLEPHNTKRYERIGNIIFGLTPLYRYSNKVAIALDATYVYNLAQQYSYNGELLYPNKRKVRGGFINVTIGLQIYLGKGSRHIDWYNGGRK